MIKMLGTKRCLSVCLLTAALAGAGIMLNGQTHQDSLVFIILVMAAKSGVSAAFCVIFLAHTSIFPVMFAATSLGLCNVLARTVSIAAPLIAQVSQPAPMLCFSLLSLISGILASFLDLKSDVGI